MAVELYEPRRPVVLHAALWKGKMEDFVGFPDFNDLVAMVIRIDGKGLLILDMTAHEGVEEVILEPDRHYLVRGITGKYWIMEVKDFEKQYNPVPKVLRREVQPLSSQWRQSDG